MFRHVASRLLFDTWHRATFRHVASRDASSRGIARRFVTWHRDCCLTRGIARGFFTWHRATLRHVASRLLFDRVFAFTKAGPVLALLRWLSGFLLNPRLPSAAFTGFLRNSRVRFCWNKTRRNFALEWAVNNKTRRN
jgi:hypothetical protein